MPIDVRCPGCQSRFQAPDKLAGRRVKCPKCSAVIEVGGAGQNKTVSKASSEKASSQAPSPSPKQPGPEEIAWYVLSTDDEQYGPMSRAELDGLVALGRLDAFCRVRQEGWDDWKWAEDVFAEFASSEAAGPTAAEARLQPCPDCGKMVSRRAGQCPNCGCPVLAPPPQTSTPAPQGQPPRAAGAKVPAPRSSQKLGWKRNKKTYLVGGGVLAVLLLVGVFVAMQLLTADDGAPLPGPEPAARSEPPPEPAPDPVTPETRQQWMKEASTAMAEEIDGLFRKVHLATSTINSAKAQADLIQALAGGDLDSIPETALKSPTETEVGAYQSKSDLLYNECLTHLRENVAEDVYDRGQVEEEARRWADGKRAPVEKQLEELLGQQLGL